MILVRRLFANWEPEPAVGDGEPSLIDYRQFVRVLAAMSQEHVEERVKVLFDVWDADEQQPLYELASHVLDLPMHKVEGAMEELPSSGPDQALCCQRAKAGGGRLYR